MVACTLDYAWPTYVIAGLISLFGGVVCILPFRLFARLCPSPRRATLARHQRLAEFFGQIRYSSESVLNGNRLASKVLVVLFWMSDLAAIGVYLASATRVDVSMRDSCGRITDDPLQYVWIILMCFSLVKFIIKFLAAQDKILMWLSVYSIVDHLTIIPTFVGIYFNRNWLGLRCLRVVHILTTANILQMIHLLKDKNKTKIVRAVSLVLAVWLFGSGMFHILENNGDPFRDYANGQLLTFWDSFYFVLISMTTIGYGDISPVTILGKAFLVAFILLTLAIFGTVIPEIGRVASRRTKYRTAYKQTFGKNHMIVCGGVTFDTLSVIVKNIIHRDVSRENTDIVIVLSDKPSSELQAFFRRHMNDVTFIVGTVLDIKTLKLAKRSKSMHADLRAVQIERCAMCVVMSTSERLQCDDKSVDRRAILTTMNILSLQKLEDKVSMIGVLTNPEVFRRQVVIEHDIPLLVSLEHDESVTYIDDDDEDDPNIPSYQTTPYACGRVLLASVLDSIVTTAFLNSEVVTLLRALITGGDTSDFEKILSDYVGIVRKTTLTDVTRARRRSTFALLPINHGILERMNHQHEYGILFAMSLRLYGVLCLGVYRLIEPDSRDTRYKRRYVITNPPQNFKLLHSDMIYVLRPFELANRTRHMSLSVDQFSPPYSHSFSSANLVQMARIASSRDIHSSSTLSQSRGSPPPAGNLTTDMRHSPSPFLNSPPPANNSHAGVRNSPSHESNWTGRGISPAGTRVKFTDGCEVMRREPTVIDTNL